ncbi:MAG: hypothetical protein A2W35_02610 [Chloroflexi bacterium RBG_16_57_11]|nr:MAG: hypothetical protein A2W35_02610 [Chloroflexi bacterium RBG_16_57_11]
MEIFQHKRSFDHWSFIVQISSWLVLCILLAYTYARFFQVPYLGFDFNPSNGEIIDVFVQSASGAPLYRGDRLVQIGSVTFDSYRADSRQPLFDGMGRDRILPVTVQRGDQRVTIRWEIPPPNLQEILDRLVNVWWLSYIFWLTGVATALLVRPHDSRWLLLIAFCFLTAIWLITGSLSTWQILESTILLRIAIWLCVPVYLHLHWVFPRPLAKSPRLILWVLYLTALGLAVAEWFQIPPRTAYFFGFILAGVGSVVLLSLHFILRPTQRREAGLLVIAIGLAILPLLTAVITRLSVAYPLWSGGGLLALLIIPGAYFYIIYRRQLGGLEMRANRLVSAYMFILLIGTIFVVLVPLADAWLSFPNASTYVGVSAVLLVLLLTLVGFPRFERFVDRRLLGIAMPPTQILEAYSSRIVTSLDLSSVIHLLRDEILPSFLVRQSALLGYENGKRISPLYVTGVDGTYLPEEIDASTLLPYSGKYLPPFSGVDEKLPFQWIRLLFSLEVNNELLGFWLLGRRDPDDYYAQAEISVLQTIANQTAIALVNAAQAERLRTLYQANIDRHEEERIKLARGLHDEILNRLYVLSMNVDRHASPSFQDHYQTVTDRLREIISDLRPAMLSYGLRPALEELTDELSERAGDDVMIVLDLPPSDARYEPKAEEYLYRIVQQACENALRHSHSSTIRIHGILDPGQVSLTVEDNGIGFADMEQLKFDRLLANRHFGLAGMHERSAIIGAELRIDGTLGGGTQVSVVWCPDEINRTSLT